MKVALETKNIKMYRIIELKKIKYRTVVRVIKEFVCVCLCVCVSLKTNIQESLEN